MHTTTTGNTPITSATPTQASEKSRDDFELWPFASSTGTVEDVQEQARRFALDALQSDRCISATLCDAYQVRPSVNGGIARAAFVGELVRLARAGLTA